MLTNYLSMLNSYSIHVYDAEEIGQDVSYLYYLAYLLEEYKMIFPKTLYHGTDLNTLYLSREERELVSDMFFGVSTFSFMSFIKDGITGDF